VAASILDRPSFTWRAFRTAWLVVRLRCPSCGLGRMASSRVTLHDRCPVCGVAFERDPGEVAGGICVNSFATTLGICALAVWLEFYSGVPPSLTTPLVVLFALVFPIAFYRHSRALWIGVLHLAGQVHRDEAADPEPVIRPWPPSDPGGGSPPVVPDRERAPRVVAAGVGRPAAGR
jgi:uncharacterized protein (DUF983 family)